MQKLLFLFVFSTSQYTKIEVFHRYFFVNMQEEAALSHSLKKSLMQNFIFCAVSNDKCRSSRSEVKDVLKICSKFTGKHPCRSVVLIKLQSSFIEIALRHWCSPVNLLRIFRTFFAKNTSGWLLL